MEEKLENNAKPPQDLADFAKQAMGAYEEYCQNLFTIRLFGHVQKAHLQHINKYSVQASTSSKAGFKDSEDIFIEVRHRIFSPPILLAWPNQ